MKKLGLCLLVVLLVLPLVAFANNVQISNVTITGAQPAEDYTLVQFDLSWENSWRLATAPANWDAVWVFVKYSNDAGSTWHHAYLNNAGNSTGTGTSATVQAGLLDEGTAFNAATNPALGAFMYRSTNGAGTFSVTDAQLRWNYGANGLSSTDIVQLKVFAVEMVYVPIADFSVGSGGTETSAFYKYPTTTNPYLIGSEDEITVGETADNLYYLSSTYGGDQAGPIPAAFPKGYAGFYCMKYEVSQQQYVDFLNTLTSTQATTRFSNNDGNYRHAISVSSGTYSTTNPYVACNYLSYMDGAAYADWSSLRPMTELEFEKACRGSESAVADEYAWGTTTVASSAYTLSNAGASNESIASNYSTTAGNASYATTDGDINGPLRVGIFATAASSRVDAGASYYGIMELSGNLWERPVTLGNSTGRAFTGVNGNGVLSTDGHADISDWPGYDTSEVTGATGAGMRGGSWNSAAASVCVSYRYYAASTATSRSSHYGARVLRGMPASVGE